MSAFTRPICVLAVLLLSVTTFAAEWSGYDSYSELLHGNRRYYEGTNASQAIARMPTHEEKPHTIVLSCSDLEVAPERVFDLGPGKLFVVRTAGHALSSEVIASIEYAVDILGAKLLVVLGHEACGTVKAALGSTQGRGRRSAHLDQLFAQVKAMPQPVRSHVAMTLRELFKKSKIIREEVGNGNLVLAQGIYRLESGKVEFWDLGEKFISETKGWKRKPTGHTPEAAWVK